jgi:DNA-binding PadR family transcriptional regulator
VDAAEPALGGLSMYRDKTLIPTEALRLCMLGTLAVQPHTYAELAREVRAFASRIVGPSLDVMGLSIEVLRAEGLVLPVAEQPDPADETLELTDTGRAELRDLMISNLRSPVDGNSQLIFALKLRFLHLLSDTDADDQIERMREISETEHARLVDLKQRYGAEPGQFDAWLDLELTQVEDRLDWLATVKPAG